MAVTKVSLVGSTGSIGTQAVEVVLASPERFEVVALAAQRSVKELAAQAMLLRPELVAIGDPTLGFGACEIGPERHRGGLGLRQDSPRPRRAARSWSTGWSASPDCR